MPTNTGRRGRTTTQHKALKHEARRFQGAFLSRRPRHDEATRVDQDRAKIARTFASVSGPMRWCFGALCCTEVKSKTIGAPRPIARRGLNGSTDGYCMSIGLRPCCATRLLSDVIEHVPRRFFDFPIEDFSISRSKIF